MNDQFNELRDLAIPFPVTASFRQQARAYALQYFTQDTHERTYLNTLALLATDAYFRLLNFQTNLTKAERWNADRRLWSEANELELVGLGNLECRVITAGQQTVVLPPEAWSDRIGYLFVEIASSEKVATLIGFLPAFDPETPTEEVAIAELKSMDEMIDYLAQQETSSRRKTGEVDNLTLEFAAKKITYLRTWLNSVYDPDWEPAMRELSAATFKKKIQLVGQVFEIQLSVSQNNGAIAVIVIVRRESGFLPIGMQVSVPDESDSDIYTETISTPADLIRILLEFSPGEEFWVELRMGETFIREYFIA
ncbi:MAG: DUF1822 family protein [Rhizonema sp. PD38]|nr:DUF1822 family protein [Rhizonema sp. PD38]